MLIGVWRRNKEFREATEAVKQKISTTNLDRVVCNRVGNKQRGHQGLPRSALETPGLERVRAEKAHTGLGLPQLGHGAAPGEGKSGAGRTSAQPTPTQTQRRNPKEHKAAGQEPQSVLLRDQHLPQAALRPENCLESLLSLECLPGVSSQHLVGGKRQFQLLFQRRESGASRRGATEHRGTGGAVLLLERRLRHRGSCS